MLVNAIAFYARPVRSLAPAALVNTNAFGASHLRQDLLLIPTIVENAQSFGASEVRVSRRYLQSSLVTNAQSFGDNQVRLANRTYLASIVFSNATGFGAHKFKKRLTATSYTNASTFGTQTVRTPEKKFSYSNALGTGDRRGTITVTTSGGSSSGTVANLVDGTTSGNPFFSGAVTFKFDLGSAKVIKQARWKQTNSTAHGLYKWQGSTDDASYADIGSAFTLGGESVNHHDELLGNDSAYRYYKLTPTTGSMSASPDIQEVEFFIEGTTQDEPATSYHAPISNGNRMSLINVSTTASLGGGTIDNFVDGVQDANNSTDAFWFVNGQSGKSITFDFSPSGKKQVIDAFNWHQQFSGDQGTWKAQGSDNGSSWTDIATGIHITGGGEYAWTNSTPYAQYRLVQTSGTTNDGPWITEIEFRAAPGVYSTDHI